MNGLMKTNISSNTEILKINNFFLTGVEKEKRKT